MNRCVSTLLSAKFFESRFAGEGVEPLDASGYEEHMSDTNVASGKLVWSPADLAAALGVTVQYVRRLVRNGTIEHYRIGVEGRRIFIPATEVEALLEGRHPAVEHRGRSAAS